MTFPTLTTGAVAQYPLSISTNRPAEIIRFLDGSDQRFIARGQMLRRWLIDLQLLNETEIAQIEFFVETLEGEYSTFTFPDPISGAAVPNCRIGGPGMVSSYESVDITATALWVIETNG